MRRFKTDGSLAAIFGYRRVRWLFPANSESGHLVEHKEGRSVLSKWGNDLRQSYRTVAQEAGISQLDIHLLMNHSLPGVTACYITCENLLGDHLLAQQERISEIIMSAAKAHGLTLTWVEHARLSDIPAATSDGMTKSGLTQPVTRSPIAIKINRS